MKRIKRIIRGVEVEVVELFEGKDEVGILVKKVGESEGEFWVVKRRREVVVRKIAELVSSPSRSSLPESFKRSFDLRFNRLGGDSHASL